MKYCGIVQPATLQLYIMTAVTHSLLAAPVPVTQSNPLRARYLPGCNGFPRPLHPTSQPVMRKKSAENFKLLVAPIGGNMTRSLYFLG
jgi:hypothetical protein